ncbi:MAG TPA: hypothetical protein VF984_01935 [Actinomycetota bacterium]
MRAIGFAWTLPNTLLGLVLGLFTFQWPRVEAGTMIFDRTPRGLTWLLPKMHRGAMTVGFVILSSEPVRGSLLVHERHHVGQYMAWGPLFLPAYFALAVPYGYRRHPFERAARRAAGEPD